MYVVSKTLRFVLVKNIDLVASYLSQRPTACKGVLLIVATQTSKRLIQQLGASWE